MSQKPKIYKSEFSKLPFDQLMAVQSKLVELRTAMKKSDYIFTDASLLFYQQRQKMQKEHTWKV